MKKGVVRLPNEKRGCTASQWKRGRTASQWKKGLYGFPMALIRDVTAKEREIHSSIIVLLDVRKEATMCIIPVIPISKFTRILTSTGKLFAGEGSLQNNFHDVTQNHFWNIGWVPGAHEKNKFQLWKRPLRWREWPWNIGCGLGENVVWNFDGTCISD